MAYQLRADHLDVASNIIIRLLHKDRQNIDLINKLKFDPNQPDKVTISGLATDDYVLLKDIEVSELIAEQPRPLPKELLDQLTNTQCIYTIGVLPTIGRAYMTIDNDLYLWNFEENSDLAYFDGIPNVITNVTIAEPIPGVFQDHVRFLFIIATCKEIIILAAVFTNANNTTIVGNVSFDVRQTEICLIPDPLFKIPLDVGVVSDLITTKNGRIFYCENDSLFELDYQNKGWFQRQCRKINHTKGILSYILPTFTILTGKEEKLAKLCIDDTRHILYGLTDAGSIHVYDLGPDGTSFSKVSALTFEQIQERAAVECRTVDASFFAEIINISPIPLSQSQHLYLLATTKRGVRLYFSCQDSVIESPHGLSSYSINPELNKRPNNLRLRHVRLPPGYGVVSFISQPFATYDAFYDQELTALASANVADETSVLWVFRSSNFMSYDCLTENLTQLHFRGVVLAISKTSSNSSVFLDSRINEIRDRNFVALRPPLIVTQHKESLEKLIILTENGLSVYNQRKPVDLLREILRQYGAESSQAFLFFQLHGAINVCDMALILLCCTDGADHYLKNAALKIFFSLNTDPKTFQNEATYLQSGKNSPSRNISIADWTFDLKIPFKCSTPQQVRSGRNAQQGTVWANGLENRLGIIESPVMEKRSYRHEALYLRFSRIIGNLWISPLCYKSSDSMVLSLLTCGEIDWLMNQLKVYKRVIDENCLIGNIHEFVQPSTLHKELSSNPHADADANAKLALQSERRSLISLCEVLSVSIEILSLWRILCAHQFHIIASQLSANQQEQLCITHFSSLVIGSHQLCAELITCLVRHYLGDNATTATVCRELRAVCPTLFSDDDALATRATEMIEEARGMERCKMRDEILNDAVKLLSSGIQKINLPQICHLLYEVGWMEGIVDLVLTRAQREDTRMLALVAYRSTSGEGDQLAQEAFSKRKEAYKCLTDALDRLLNDIKSKNASEMNSSIIDRDLIINSVLQSTDELANVTIFKWLLDNDMSSLLLKCKSPFVESFLHRRVQEGGSSRYLDLLWRFHEKNGDFPKAAKLLYDLSQRNTDAFDIVRRISYLSQAAICAQSGTNESTNDLPHNFLTEVRDKLEVAQIQLATKSAISSLKASRSVSIALQNIEKRLYTVQELFEHFAIPLDLPDIKLELCHCSATYDADIIECLCCEIVDKALETYGKNDSETIAQQFGTYLNTISRKYLLAPKYFPSDVLIRKLLMVAIDHKFPPAFMDTVIALMTLPLNLVLDTYASCFSSEDLWDENQSVCLYLMKSVFCILKRFANSMQSFSIDKRRSLANQCLDLIAVFFVPLQTCQSLPSVEKSQILDGFRTLQKFFESV